MKKLVAGLIVCAATMLAQDATERATVPLHDPSRPAHIHVNLMMGGVTVKGYDGKEVLIEARTRGTEDTRRGHSPKADGMRRLDLPGNAGLDVTEEDNEVKIRTGSTHRPTDLTISVPRKSSLELKCLNDGDIYVEDITGEIDADNLNGKVTLKRVSGSVLAHSLNGEVVVTFDRIDPTKPMSFSTLNGDIDVTLPDNLKANVHMKSDHGDIYSDFEVKLAPNAGIAKTEAGRQQDGTFHLQFDRALRGTINGGGPEYQFTTFNGQIYLRKKK